MVSNSILNCITISDRITSSGQPDAIQFEAISQAGFQVIINLAMPNSDNAISNEGSLVTSLGMTYIHIPVPFDSPSLEHLKLFFHFMQTCSDKHVWVHCAVNKRASAFLYLYQTQILNIPAIDAKNFLLPEWIPDTIWQKFLALDVKA